MASALPLPGTAGVEEHQSIHHWRVVCIHTKSGKMQCVAPASLFPMLMNYPRLLARSASIRVPYVKTTDTHGCGRFPRMTSYPVVCCNAK